MPWGCCCGPDGRTCESARASGIGPADRQPRDRGEGSRTQGRRVGRRLADRDQAASSDPAARGAPADGAEGTLVLPGRRRRLTMKRIAFEVSKRDHDAIMETIAQFLYRRETEG